MTSLFLPKVKKECPAKSLFCFVLFFEGFIESSPYVEKIKAFEKYFTSQIDLYDKVCNKYSFKTVFCAMCKHVVTEEFFFSNRMKLKEKAASWWTIKTCL